MQQQKSFIELTLPDYTPMDVEEDICVLEEALEHLVYNLGDVWNTQETLKSFSRTRRRILIANLRSLAMKLETQLPED